MYKLFYKDNNRGVCYKKGFGLNKDYNGEELEEITTSLNTIANKSLKDLLPNNKNLLVFPLSFNTNKDDVEKEPIFKLYSDDILHTGNLMGFFGNDKLNINIGSRFDTGENEQYFMQYMLQKVFAINLVNLNTQATKENIWDFLLIYMFPYFLNKALNQGLYKEYKKVKHNNANVKGAIDIARHIRQNIPFAGRIAYNTREFSFDNNITQLIRHTIEYITSKKYGNALKNTSTTIDNVKQIIAATPTYNIRERQSVIQNNFKKVNHPFFTEYEDLRIICQKILHKDGLSMQTEKEKVHGLLFDGAWLWEEYLNTILKDIGFKHPENKINNNAIYLFEDNKYPRYPDFYKYLNTENSIIIDAKYKHLEWSSIDRDDLHQVISYMYVLKAKQGFILYPYSENKINYVGVLKGYGGTFYKYGMEVPNNTDDFIAFAKQMKTNENKLKENVQSITENRIN